MPASAAYSRHGRCRPYGNLTKDENRTLYRAAVTAVRLSQLSTDNKRKHGSIQRMAQRIRQCDRIRQPNNLLREITTHPNLEERTYRQRVKTRNRNGEERHAGRCVWYLNPALRNDIKMKYVP